MSPALKKRVVLASVMKPVDDTRMYEKMALSLVQTNRFSVTVIGAYADVQPAQNLQTMPLGRFGRLSLARVLAPFKVWVRCYQLKPEILIVNTHELLLVALANRILFGSLIWYDVQENYYRNIRFGGAFPPILRLLLALFVRAKEKALAPFFTGFFLAERGYAHEMNFFGNRAVVLENKVSGRHLMKRKKGGSFTFLFSGTLAASTGVFEAIQLVKNICQTGAPVKLLVIGYAAQPTVRDEVRAACRNAECIRLEGVDRLVPHARIMEAIAQADAGIIAYPHSPHTQHSIPTKLYEYLGCQLPVVCTRHPVWSALIAKWQGGISIDFANYVAHEVWHAISTRTFYPTPPAGVFWEDEAPRFLKALEFKTQDST